MEVKITVKCVDCGRTKEVGEEQKDLPMCEFDYCPMLAQKVKMVAGVKTKEKLVRKFQ